MNTDIEEADDQIYRLESKVAFLRLQNNELVEALRELRAAYSLLCISVGEKPNVQRSIQMANTVLYRIDCGDVKDVSAGEVK